MITVADVLSGPGWEREDSAVVQVDHEPSAETAREIHADAVRLARNRMLWGLPATVIAVGLVAVAAATPSLWFLAMCGAALVAGCIRAGVEWHRLRRADPIENWRREQAEAARDSHEIVEHETRVLGVSPDWTYALSILVAIVSLVQLLLVGLPASIPIAALVKTDVTAGEWWRLLSASFVHGNLLHLCANLAGLLAVGGLVETYDKPVRLPLIYLVGVVCSSVASFVVTPGTSVGASGGVLGVLGYLIVRGNTDLALPTVLKKNLLGSLGNTALIGAAAFFVIDNAGHAGGALAGATLAFLIFRVERRGKAWPALLDGCGYVAAVSLLAAGLFTLSRLLSAL